MMHGTYNVKKLLISQIIKKYLQFKEAGISYPYSKARAIYLFPEPEKYGLRYAVIFFETRKISCSNSDSNPAYQAHSPVSINLLATDFFFQILAHPVFKM